MSIDHIDIGPRMSQVVIHGNTVYLAGQVAEENAGMGADVQTAEALEWVDRLLAKAGTDKSRLLAATIHLADMADFDAMNRVWEAWIDPARPPVRTCVEARLAAPEFTVEVTVVAAL